MATVGGQPLPTHSQLAKAGRMLRDEYGDPFYRVATELVDLSYKRHTKVSLADALATLLLTWNRGYYRYHPELSRTLVDDLEALLVRHKKVLAEFRTMSIRSLRDVHEGTVREIFDAFDERLGPVGASKALHLIAPRLFPLWDTKIAQAYGVGGHGGTVRMASGTSSSCTSSRSRADALAEREAWARIHSEP